MTRFALTFPRDPSVTAVPLAGFTLVIYARLSKCYSSPPWLLAILPFPPSSAQLQTVRRWGFQAEWRTRALQKLFTWKIKQKDPNNKFALIFFFFFRTNMHLKRKKYGILFTVKPRAWDGMLCWRGMAGQCYYSSYCIKWTGLPAEIIEEHSNQWPCGSPTGNMQVVKK